jgi:hypothetical protein
MGGGVNTSFEQNLINQGAGVQIAPGQPVVAPGEMPVTQAEMDAFNQVSDPFLASGAAGGARLPTTSDPFLVSGAAGGARLSDEQQDPAFLEKARDNFIATGQDIGNTFKDLVGQGIDISKMAGTTIANLIGKAVTGVPLLGTAINMLPGDTPEDTFNRQFAIEGQSFQDIATSDPDFARRLQGYSSALNPGQNISGRDPFGRNTVSALGDYEARLAEDLQYTGDNQFNKDKKAYAQAYFDKKGIGLNPNEAKAFEEKYGISPTGAPVTRDRLIDEGIAAADEEDDMFEPAPTGVNPFADIDTGVGEFGETPTGITQPGTLASPEFNRIEDYIKDDVTDAELYGDTSVTNVGNPFGYEDPIMDMVDLEENGGGGGGGGAAKNVIAGYQKQIKTLEALKQRNLDLNIDNTETDAAIKKLKEFIKAEEEEVTAEENGGGGGGDDMDFDIDSVTTAKGPPSVISRPTFTPRGGGADRDPGPTPTPKGLSGPPSVISRPTPTFEPRGGGADRDPGPSRSAPVSTAGQAGPPSQRGGGGGGNGGGGGGKIVCTMMNNSYGFGSFRNKIWLRHSKDLAPEYQIGYHKIFLPLVRLSKTNKLLKKTLEHIAVHRTIDIRQEARGKKHLLGRVYRKVLEPICYIVGKYAKR